LGRLCIVFSLVALVFAACSDGDSGGGGFVGKEVHDIIVLKNPTAPYSFEGMPIDLTGIEVQVNYVGGSWEIIKDPSKFFTMTHSGATSPGSLAGTPNIFTVGASSNAPFIKAGVNRTIDSDGTGKLIEVSTMPKEASYGVAEYRILDYVVGYNPPNGREPKFAPIRINGVLDLDQQITLMTGLPEQKYYIDDEVDFSSLQVQLWYNDQRGFFLDKTGFGAYAGDMQGNPICKEVQYKPYWEASLNYPRGYPNQRTGNLPFLRVAFGDRIVRASGGTLDADSSTPRNDGNEDYKVGEHLYRRDWHFEELYVAKELNVTTPPSVPLEFTNDYKRDYPSMREEWLHKVLKDVVITVTYEEVNNKTPSESIPKKTIVLDDRGDRMKLPLDKYFARRPFFPVSGANYDSNVLLSGQAYQGPAVYGSLATVRNGELENGDIDDVLGTYDPFNSSLVFTHENSERLNRINPLSSMSRFTTIPVEVYVLTDTLTIKPVAGTDLTFPTLPPDKRGKAKDFFDSFEVYANYEWVDLSGGGAASKTKEKKIELDDERLVISAAAGSANIDGTPIGDFQTKPVVIENLFRTQGTNGIYDENFWKKEGSYDITFSYWIDVSMARINDPAFMDADGNEGLGAREEGGMTLNIEVPDTW